MQSFFKYSCTQTFYNEQKYFLWAVQLVLIQIIPSPKEIDIPKFKSHVCLTILSNVEGK